MKDIEKGKNLEITVNELIEQYSWMLTESNVQSIKKYGKMQTKTKKSVIKSLQQKFESVEYIAGKKNQKAKFILTNYNGSTEVYNPYKNNGGQSLDWSNEINCIQELINKEVALSQDENFYKGFTVNQLFEKMVGFNKYKIKAIAKEEVSKHRIFTLSGKQKEDEFHLRDTVNNLVRNQKRIYMAMIEKEIKKTNHKIDYLDSNGEEIDVERYEEYVNYKKLITRKLKVKNNKEKELKNKYFKLGLSTKDFDIKNEVQLLKEIENAVQEIFQFKFAYRLFTVLDEIQVEGEGDIEKVRENFFNRIMKNANSSQSKHLQAEGVNYSETVFYRLCHAGQYQSIMKSIFSKLIDIESKTQKFDAVQEYEKAQAEQSLELYLAEQRLEQEEEFYNQDDFYIDVEWMLQEQQAQKEMTNEECQERYFELLEY
ncbi:hypothetical protein [Lactococcus lactis]|uniref:hypothetical protein n=1 Tax=Lactococcus lactis TaxID=1358 RepID=UPI00071D8CE0|nr:hypothetical protein [Lactococcus lactis]KST89924.1 hypothetical protein LKF24_2119 [Lactococcus lactis subsp. lactis]